MPGFYETIARFYDAENRDKVDDLALYSELAEEYGGPILDVGCGTGRVMLHLAQEDYDVHGIDSEYTMLERAEGKREAHPHLEDKMTFYHGDVLTTPIEKRFRMVLLTFNALMHFHEQDTQIKLLKRMRELLDVGGVVVIDLPNAGETFASEDSDQLTLARTFLEPESGNMVMQQSVSYLDRTTQVMHVTWFYDEITADGTVKRTMAPLNMRYFFYSEVQLLLMLTGFELVETYGDTDGSPLEDGTPRMIMIARAAKK